MSMVVFFQLTWERLRMNLPVLSPTLSGETVRSGGGHNTLQPSPRQFIPSAQPYAWLLRSKSPWVQFGLAPKESVPRTAPFAFPFRPRSPAGALLQGRVNFSPNRFAPHLFPRRFRTLWSAIAAGRKTREGLTSLRG